MASEYNEFIEKDGKMVAKPQTKAIWKTFWILLIITVLEFVVAFSLPHHYHILKVAIFVGMTLIKAAYIMGDFMHLSQETKGLFWTILVPIVFIAWLVLALLLEGGFISTY
ncbi:MULTISPECIES: cytochrome C oxidase subunit IV family protein [unclassified Siphonobacter]|uniref:cytochrome C oxidase subunit IV family protein n=1 Tax=unclassified Siphonobacter TaxID=2635712 RepID=UPI0018E39B40|nr:MULTISPECIES: cytochrome C oxidase subunit IV family protein [unclassified Siphonobacter]MDQ1086461.1 cytochrome c oxidase subunit 4 [Siphonobacter sp. SORGH_AS_1065]MDR6196732.1 cytochrome c oxidase subunit 4 [Siphonobacter sp. SORGH_AS_0500]